MLNKKAQLWNLVINNENDWNAIKDSSLFKKLNGIPIAQPQMDNKVSHQLNFMKQTYLSEILSTVKTIPCSLEQVHVRKSKRRIKATIKEISFIGKMANRITKGNTYFNLLKEYSDKKDGDSIVELVSNRNLLLQIENDLKLIDTESIQKEAVSESIEKVVNNKPEQKAKGKRKGDSKLIDENWGILDRQTKELLRKRNWNFNS